MNEQRNISTNLNNELPQDKKAEDSKILSHHSGADKTSHSSHSSSKRRKRASKKNHSFLRSNFRTFLVLACCFLVLAYVIYRIFSREKDILGAEIIISLTFLTGVEAIIFALFLNNKYRQIKKSIFASAIIGLHFLSFLAFSIDNILNPVQFFIILILINTFSIIIAHVNRDQLFAFLGLLGIAVIPFLLSDKTLLIDLYFTYLVFVTTILYTLSFFKKWKHPIYISSAISWIITFTWIIRLYLNDISFISILPYVILMYLTFHLTYIFFRFTQHKKSDFVDNLLLISNFAVFNFSVYSILYLDTTLLTIKIFTVSNLIYHIIICLLIYAQKKKHVRLYRTSEIFGLVITYTSIFLIFRLPLYAPLLAIIAIILFFYGRTRKIPLYIILSIITISISALFLIYYLLSVLI